MKNDIAKAKHAKIANLLDDLERSLEDVGVHEFAVVRSEMPSFGNYGVVVHEINRTVTINPGDDGAVIYHSSLEKITEDGEPLPETNGAARSLGSVFMSAVHVAQCAHERDGQFLDEMNLPSA